MEKVRIVFSFSPRTKSSSTTTNNFFRPADELFYKGQLLHLSPRLSTIRTLLLASSSSSDTTTTTSSPSLSVQQIIMEKEDELTSLEGKMEGQARLYEAYNELHDIAQEFETPFVALAVLVVGHQIDGKSALVEALMGFQFNHIGGGTKTRRPITLHMKYDPDCEVPLCHLVSDVDPTVADPDIY